MTAVSHLTMGVLYALHVVVAAVQAQGYVSHGRTPSPYGVKAFSVYRTSRWKDDSTVTYDGIEVDTTVGWIEMATGTSWHRMQECIDSALLA